MTVAAQRAMTTREWGLLALLSLLWGGSYFFVGVAIREIPPLTLVTLRVGVAAALLWVGAPIRGVVLPRDGKAIVALAVLGLCNNALPFALIAYPFWNTPQLAEDSHSPFGPLGVAFLILYLPVLAGLTMLGAYLHRRPDGGEWNRKERKFAK